MALRKHTLLPPLALAASHHADFAAVVIGRVGIFFRGVLRVNRVCLKGLLRYSRPVLAPPLPRLERGQLSFTPIFCWRLELLEK
jgi:hypothetical protein